MTPGTKVTWTDGQGHKHTGTVTEFPDPPKAMSGQVYVMETITVDLPHWLHPKILEAQ